ncbi:MAG: peptidoglycan bridge formation glycyltransferase FemA/FemB family protein [Cellvibrio sp.]|uniref:lipid II:glycine glycyltransferase FemX n=1 Tax=Cellvibrio sp. TaxID=1965322 RepID=UPI0027179EA9|nr:peptidoglycan bridge formation glycyltransferase FemA/FemB family protein [Cellvibrio sp.]
MPHLTHSPLPEWRDLVAVLVSAPVPDDELSVAWRRDGDEAFWFSRSAWSLVVVARLRQRMAGKENVTVWIPDFFCNASLAPLRDIGASLVFYRITDQTVPDLSMFDSLANTNPPDIFVLVHYFGQPTPTESIVAFCKEQGAWLVEDATHVLQPVTGIGEVGDCVMYSPHKHLPISDGAVLVVRSSGPAQLGAQSAVMDLLRKINSALLDSSGYSNQRAIIWLIKRILQRLGLRSPHSEVTFREEAAPSVSVAAHPKMSALAKRLLTQLTDRLDAVADIRKQHGLDWNYAVSANLDSTIKPLPSKDTPYLAGFTCNHGTDTELLFNRMRRNDLPATTWPDLPPEVLERADVHSAAMALRHNRLYLPVHQSLMRQQILAYEKSMFMTATIKWKVRTLPKDEWENYWQQCHQAPLLQSAQYGDAKAEADGLTPQRLLISDGDDQPIALAQMLTRTLPVVGGVARLNRGPLLLADVSGEAAIQMKLAAFQVLLREARRRRWWIVQVAPELPPTDESAAGLEALGFNKRSIPAWGSARLRLTVDEQTLLMGLNGKWRNCLRKGEKLGVTVTHHECGGEKLELLMRSYTMLQNNRGFEGLSENLIRALARQQGDMWQFNLFMAEESGAIANDGPLGMLVTIRSGDTAIYLIGSTNDKGRQMQANSVLLWQAVVHAKRSGCTWFDIGGLSNATPKGIAEFKQGLNAVSYELVGEWRKFIWCN